MLTPNAEEGVNAALAAHNKVRRYDLEGEEHAIVMLLVDLIEFAAASSPPLNFAAMVDAAQEVVSDCA